MKRPAGACRLAIRTLLASIALAAVLAVAAYPAIVGLLVPMIWIAAKGAERGFGKLRDSCRLTPRG